MKKKEICTEAQADRLAIIVEESTRASTSVPPRFVEPANGTLDRAKSQRHQIIFGRRGSGKTSLLRKASVELAINNTPITFIDLESFKNHSYPDLVLGVMLKTFDDLVACLDGVPRRPWWWTKISRFFFGSIKGKNTASGKKVDSIREAISNQRSKLQHLLHSGDGNEIAVKTVFSNERTQSGGISSAVGIQSGRLTARTDEATKISHADEVLEHMRRSKIDYLHRQQLDFQRILHEVSLVFDGPVYVFIDESSNSEA